MTRRIMVRLTDEEYDEVRRKAEECCLTICAYTRHRLKGAQPRLRMTEEERTAIGSLSDARGDIVKLFGFLKGKPLNDRERIMRSQIFMQKWKEAAQTILGRMVEIEKSFNE